MVSRGVEETTRAFYRRLTPEDRLNLMKMNYPLPADVEPPVAPTTTAAFSSALRVTMSRGRMLRRTRSITALPDSMAQRSRSS